MEMPYAPTAIGSAEVRSWEWNQRVSCQVPINLTRRLVQLKCRIAYWYVPATYFIMHPLRSLYRYCQRCPVLIGAQPVSAINDG